MNPRLPKTVLLSSAFIALLLLVPPVAATLALTDVSYTPNLPLVIGGEQHMIATFYLVPSSATTFIKNHELQMQTDLANARWNIQVIQNGHNAAQQTASGSAAFVSGEILSYPNSNDISLSVTVDGVVPQSQNNLVMLLTVEEIDNNNNVVPGSVITISQPVAGQPAAGVQTVLPTLTPPVIPSSPTKSAGFPIIAAILAIGLVVLISERRDS